MRFLRSIGAALALLATANLALAQGTVGTPRYNTKPAGDNATYAGTTEYTDRAVATLLASVNGTLAQKAPLASPNFTGTAKFATGSATNTTALQILESTSGTSTRAIVQIGDWSFLQDRNATGPRDFAVYNTRTNAVPFYINTDSVTIFNKPPVFATPAASDNSTSAATTAFVNTAATSIANAAVATLGTPVRADAAQTLTDAQKAQAIANLGLGPVTICQCQLQYASATQLKLMPVAGTLIWINGTYRTIPVTGVSFPNTGLANGWSYYLYAYWTGTAVALEASTTLRALDTTWGYQIKSGDPTRTLVGGFVTDGATFGVAGNGFVEEARRRYVASYYNRRNKTLVSLQNPGGGTAQTSGWIALNSRAYFFAWDDEAVSFSANGYSTNNTAGAWSQTAILLDEVAVGGSTSLGTSATAGSAVPIGARIEVFTSDGLHGLVPGGQVSSGSGLWYVNGNGFVRN